MSNLHHRRAQNADTRLAIVTRVSSDLKAQLSKLNHLRERVRKAERSAQRRQLRYAPIRRTAERVEAGSERML
jgi:hypothetical protein